MAQVNISVDDHIVASLDRVADAKGLRRPDLLRAAIAELIEAHDSNRLAFQVSDGPKLDASISSLIHQLREALIELDRAQAENAKLFGRLIAETNGGEEANRAALNRLTKQINDINSKSYEPFLQNLMPIRKAITALPGEVVSTLQPSLAKIEAQLEANRKLAEQPRVQHILSLGDDRTLSLKFLSATYGLAICIGAVLALIVPSLFQTTQLAVAGRLINEPAQLCRLIKHEYGVRDCVVPKSEQAAGLRIIASEDTP